MAYPILEDGSVQAKRPAEGSKGSCCHAGDGISPSRRRRLRYDQALRSSSSKAAEVSTQRRTRAGWRRPAWLQKADCFLGPDKKQASRYVRTFDNPHTNFQAPLNQPNFVHWNQDIALLSVARPQAHNFPDCHISKISFRILRRLLVVYTSPHI